MDRSVEEYEVVVVGAGPAGLASAIALALHGVSVLVIERRPGVSNLPRANTASTGTMELLRRWGLEDAVLERAVEVEWRARACRSLADAAAGQAIEVGYPSREQAALVSPVAPACIGQDELEPLLEDHLAGLPSARVDRGVEVVGLAEGPNGIDVELASDGRRRRVRARYAIGADGIRSRVRAELEIGFPGSEDSHGRLSVMFRGPAWDLVGERRNIIYFLDDKAAGTAMLPVGGRDRWVFAVGQGSVQDGAEVAPDRLRELVRNAAGDRLLPVEIERAAWFRFGTGLADSFRRGNVFLVGDAAHRVTPRGGTGLNTAMRDGYDIGWKLAWVLRGWAGEGLLDSYERERRPVAEFNIDRSSRADGSILATAAGLSADIGGRIAHAWVPRGERLDSTLDLLGDGLTLLVGPSWAGPPPQALSATPPFSVERLDGIAARAVGLAHAGALLVRPDGHPVALWNDGAPAEDRLDWAVAAVTARPNLDNGRVAAAVSTGAWFAALGGRA